MAAAGIRLHSRAAGHIVPVCVEDMDGAVPTADRMLPHPAQIPPGQGLSEAGVDLSLLLQQILGHTRPLHHGSDQMLHIQHRRYQQGLGRVGNGQPGKIRPNAVGPQGKGLPAVQRPGGSLPDVRHRRPGREFFRPLLPRPVPGEVDGQNLKSPGAGRPGKCSRLFFAAHLPVQEQIDCVCRIPIQKRRYPADHQLFGFHKTTFPCVQLRKTVYARLQRRRCGSKALHDNPPTAAGCGFARFVMHPAACCCIPPAQHAAAARSTRYPRCCRRRGRPRAAQSQGRGRPAAF